MKLLSEKERKFLNIISINIVLEEMNPARHNSNSMYHVPEHYTVYA
jgi:hypothetical protein